MINSPPPIRLGIVGVGAVSEYCHLPAAISCPEVVLSCLVDFNEDRARTVAARFSIPKVFTRLDEAIPFMDGAIVATPNNTHVAITTQLLAAGVNVLCEKPIALTPADVSLMLATAETSGKLLAAGHVRRFWGSSRLIRQVLDSQILGKLKSVRAFEGQAASAMSTTFFALNREQAGGGVLLDWGSHAIDQLIFWLGSSITLLDYQDNSLGGVESDCLMHARFNRDDTDVDCTLELSKTRDFDQATFDCERGRIVAAMAIDCPLSIEFASTVPLLLSAELANAWDGSPADPFLMQMKNFARSIAGTAKLEMPGEIAAYTVRLIDECYRNRRQMAEPWAFSKLPDAKQPAVEGSPNKDVAGR